MQRIPAAPPPRSLPPGGPAAKYAKNEKRHEDKRREDIEGAVHDLRSPLSSLRSQLDSLISQLENLAARNPELRVKLDRMKRLVGSIEAAANNLRVLLQLSGASPMPEATEPILIANVVVEVIDDLFELSRQKNVQFLQRGAPGNSFVNGNRAQLQRLFHNLFFNALMYGHAGRPVYVQLNINGENIVTSVTSEGLPIPDALASSIFRQPKSRGNEARRVNPGGAGLGLYVSQSIAESHGGWIRLHRPGINIARFEVTLPLAAPTTAAPRA